jgi:hypothetical protein
MADVTLEQLADEMFKLVEGAEGKKNLKPGDLIKAMKRQYGIDKKTGKKAIRVLIESSRCVYSYFGGSFITLPKMEGAAKESQGNREE